MRAARVERSAYVFLESIGHVPRDHPSPRQTARPMHLVVHLSLEGAIFIHFCLLRTWHVLSLYSLCTRGSISSGAALLVASRELVPLALDGASLSW
mmetsp:Transcript_1876/g.5865  ORF Transcript_1876/g.5865 Transcript_1876/m.5865 type:complete len:96 (-) Transcript_1876:70-357(-)